MLQGPQPIASPQGPKTVAQKGLKHLCQCMNPCQAKQLKGGSKNTDVGLEMVGQSGELPKSTVGVEDVATEAHIHTSTGTKNPAMISFLSCKLLESKHATFFLLVFKPIV